METAEFYIQQLNTATLSVFSYYVESNKQALIIDPVRDHKQYTKIIESRGAKLNYILLTHFHADFVSSHQELAKIHGATIVFGSGAKGDFEFLEAKDNHIIELGNIKIKVIHTPGHTMESSCFLLLTPSNEEYCVFTGDTLFLNEVGRPDLAVSSAITSKELAGYLFDSLNLKLAKLNDATIVYPGHGSGSLCGKKIGCGSSSTIGDQRKTNYAFNVKKEDFIQIATDNLGTPPAYFFYNAKLNKSNRKLYDEVYSGIKPLTFEEFRNLRSEANTIVIDTRDPSTQIKTGYIPNSYMVSLAVAVESIAGNIISPSASILLVAENDKLEESMIRLSRIGFDLNIKGYLNGGFDTWVNSGGEIQIFKRISPDEFKTKLENKDVNGYIVDVRNPPEWETGIIPGAIMISLKELEQKADSVLKKENSYYLHCKLGGRSHVGYSIMKRLGYENIVDIMGGLDKLKEIGVEVVKP